MTEPKTDTEEAKEAASVGEKPDLGHTADALKDALTGSDLGSDTRAGSLQGGAATGSDDDPDQDVINESLASEGMREADQRVETGERIAAKGQPGDDVDAPTG